MQPARDSSMSFSSAIRSPAMSPPSSNVPSSLGLAHSQSSSFPTSHNRTHLPPLSALMAASPYSTSNGRHSIRSALRQQPLIAGSSQAAPNSLSDPSLSDVQTEHHPKRRRTLSPPNSHTTPPSSSSYPSQVHPYPAPTYGQSYNHPGRSMMTTEADSESTTDPRDEMTGGRLHTLPLPRRGSSGSSPAAGPNNPGISARAPPSMSIVSSTSSVVIQGPSATMSTDSTAGPSKQWKTPTGHRRGITVREMLPLEAPTQLRKRGTPSTGGAGSRPGSSSGPPTQSPPNFYSNDHTEDQAFAPSSTGRPAKRRRRSVSVADSVSPAQSSNLSLELEAEEYGSPAMSTSHSAPSNTTQHQPTSSSQSGLRASSVKSSAGGPDPAPGELSNGEDPLALKRRQNTIAARRSRQRKLEHVRALEDQVSGLTRERDELRSRVARLEDRVTFLKEIVAGGGTGGAGSNITSMVVSPRVPSIPVARQVSGKRVSTTSWDDNHGEELHDDDDSRRDHDDEYDEGY